MGNVIHQTIKSRIVNFDLESLLQMTNGIPCNNTKQVQ